MSTRFASLEEVIRDHMFLAVDVALRRGRHIDREDGDWYAFITDAQDHLEQLYRRYGCELVTQSDGYFYLLPTGDQLSRRHLSAGEMLVGQTLALQYLDPSTIQSGGVVTHRPRNHPETGGGRDSAAGDTRLHRDPRRGPSTTALTPASVRRSCTESLRHQRRDGASHRSFLLKEESGLADTLVRMRSNLDACRRTRTEVHEAQDLEREISGVYEAGHAMFAAALLATRERAEELRRRMEEAKVKRDTALRERDAVAGELKGQTDERTRVEQRLTKAKEEHEAARKQQERIAAANSIAKRVAGFEDELRGVRKDLSAAELALKGAEEKKVLRAGERARAEETYRRAAEGLADLQRGLEELHRRADAHRTVMRRLAEGRAVLERPDLAAHEVDAHVETTTAAIATIDGRRNELDAAIGGAEAHAADHGEAMRAVRSILGEEVDPRDAHVQARTALRTLSELDGIAARAESLDEDLGRARDSLRPPSGVGFVRADAKLDAMDVASVLGEVAVTERALLDGTVLTGTVRAALLVENLGPYQDLEPPDGWLVVHVPGWDTATVRLFLAQLRDVPIAHFGDLDPAGVRIVRHLRQIHPDLKWAVPDFWGECIEKRALPGEWPEDLNLDDAPALIRDLAHRNLWLEQELIAVDPRLRAALEAAAGDP